MKSAALKPGPMLLAAVTGLAGFLAGRHQSPSPAPPAGLSLPLVTAATSAAARPSLTPPGGRDLRTVYEWLGSLTNHLPADADGDAAAMARLLLRHWQSGLAPAKAWAAAAELPDSPLRSVILERLWPDLAASDPDGAWAASFLLEAETSTSARLQLVTDWLAAGRQPADLAPLLNAAPESERESVAAATMVALTAQSPAGALETAQALTDPSTRAAAFLTIAGEWAQSDPSAAAAWSLSCTGEAPGALSAVIQHWAASDVTAASAWLASQPPGPARDAAAPALVEALVYTDIPAAREWAGNISDESARSGMLARLDLAARSGPAVPP